jgi:plasmid stabilization system protein ParE
MKGYEFTPQAATDLFEIWLYIAEDNPQAAEKVEDAILASCALLASASLTGPGSRRLDASAS